MTFKFLSMSTMLLMLFLGVLTSCGDDDDDNEEKRLPADIMYSFTPSPDLDALADIEITYVDADGTIKTTKYEHTQWELTWNKFFPITKSTDVWMSVKITPKSNIHIFDVMPYKIGYKMNCSTYFEEVIGTYGHLVDIKDDKQNVEQEVIGSEVKAYIESLGTIKSRTAHYDYDKNTFTDWK